MKEQFVNQYPISKTLRFSLIPIGKTEENFNKNLLLKEDEKKAEEYQKVKGYIDRYHKFFIETALCNINFEGFEEYSLLYYKCSKDDNDLKTMEDIEIKLRKQISKTMTSHKLYKDLFGENMIKTILPNFLDSDEEKNSLEMFRGFYTYFSGFNTNRKNMYTEEAKSTSIAYRCINDNLPKFLDNSKSFEKIKCALNKEELKAKNEEFYEIFQIYATDIFNIDFFNFVLTQPGIDKYNGIIGGYTCSDGTKVQGLNEIINLYNQQIAKDDKSKRLPLLKMLYKQILSDRETVSFIPEKFSSDNEVLESINNYFSKNVSNAIKSLKELFQGFEAYNMNGIFISSGVAITDLSNAVFGDWNAISTAWEKAYFETNPPKKNKSQEKYEEELKANYKKIKSFSLDEIQRLGSIAKSPDSIGSVAEYYKITVTEKIDNITELYDGSKELLNCNYSESYDKKLIKNDTVIEKVKTLLDAVKSLEKLIKPLVGTGKEDKDELFYGTFLPLYTSLSAVDRLYDKVRNYATQKPYSKDKIKLNFNCSSFLSGWATDYSSNGGLIFEKDGLYYLGIVNKKFTTEEIDYLQQNADENPAQRIVYDFQKPDNKNTPRLFIRSKGTNYSPSVKEYNLPVEEIVELYDKRYFTTEYRNKNPELYKASLVKLIDYFKLGFTRHESYRHYDFKWKKSEEYNDISEFYKDVEISCYSLKQEKINYNTLLNFVAENRIYLFQIYNKDFSKYSKGTPNLHTRYFKALFDENNLSDVVFKLNGGSEMFFRKASIKDNEKVVHPANQPIDNKNPDNSKKQSTFDYELIKDKRFTKHQFSIHIPITMNFKARGRDFINNDIRKAIKSEYKPYVIGIDRGERNLIYISVINNNGEIVEQMSLNDIISDNGYKVDYQRLLDRKEKERDNARKSWGTIENIKELKEGYISQVIHKICELVIKYDAVIAMEDLNFGFKRGRFNVEKQVYQKFENMLISKLNYLCDKKSEANSEGGLLKAYQLTNKFDGVNKGKQNGIIFYVPAWLTSKIDPVTGFVDLLHPKYISVEETHSLFEKLDDIRYNFEKDMFEFDIDYSKLPKCNADFKQKWTVCTNADRIMTFRNSEKNNEWDNKRILLSDEFKRLFEEFGIDYCHNLKNKILSISNKDFCYRFIKLFALTMQMRNSITGSTNPEDDYLISPVRDENGVFYDSRNFIGSKAGLPIDADANGAYNIARKGLWAINAIKSTADDMLDKVDLSISNAKWLEYVQK